MTERRRADLHAVVSSLSHPLAPAQYRARSSTVETFILCFFVGDQPPRDRWRFSLTSQPVTHHTRYLSRVLKTKVYAAHTLYGDMTTQRKLEAYLDFYALGEGWFGPLSEETMRGLFLRLKNEGPAFLENEFLE